VEAAVWSAVWSAVEAAQSAQSAGRLEFNQLVKECFYDN
jgi:hypothetical protein